MGTRAAGGWSRAVCRRPSGLVFEGEEGPWARVFGTDTLLLARVEHDAIHFPRSQQLLAVIRLHEQARADDDAPTVTLGGARHFDAVGDHAHASPVDLEMREM